jgi:hypothetical protein
LTEKKFGQLTLQQEVRSKIREIVSSSGDTNTDFVEKWCLDVTHEIEKSETRRREKFSEMLKNGELEKIRANLEGRLVEMAKQSDESAGKT